MKAHKVEETDKESQTEKACSKIELKKRRKHRQMQVRQRQLKAPKEAQLSSTKEGRT